MNVYRQLYSAKYQSSLFYSLFSQSYLQYRYIRKFVFMQTCTYLNLRVCA